jgi:hypothetical protein
MADVYTRPWLAGAITLIFEANRDRCQPG